VSFHLRSENENFHRKISIVRVIVGFHLHSENKNPHHKILAVGVTAFKEVVVVTE